MTHKKKKRFVKGSPEAKAYMKKLRASRKGVVLKRGVTGKKRRRIKKKTSRRKKKSSGWLFE